MRQRRKGPAVRTRGAQWRIMKFAQRNQFPRSGYLKYVLSELPVQRLNAWVTPCGRSSEMGNCGYWRPAVMSSIGSATMPCRVSESWCRRLPRGLRLVSPFL